MSIGESDFSTLSIFRERSRESIISDTFVFQFMNEDSGQKTRI